MPTSKPIRRRRRPRWLTWLTYPWAIASQVRRWIYARKYK